MKHTNLSLVSLLVFLSLGAACISPTSDTNSNSSQNSNAVQQTNTVSAPDITTPTNSSTNQVPQVSTSVNCPLPVQNDKLYFYTSADGLNFTKQKFIQSLSSVPNIIYDSAEENYILSFQSFEGKSDLCDKLAYVRLSQDGEVIGSVQPINISSSTYFTGFDPTLVEFNGKFILVYTVRPPGKKFPCISVAVSKSADIADGFTNLDQIVWCSNNDSENFMDPSAVVVEQDGKSLLYIYTPKDSAMASGTPASYYAIVDASSSSTSDWSLTESGEVGETGAFLLGEMVSNPTDAACPYAFYGTAQGNIKRACSSDGLHFSSQADSLFSGADPAVTLAPDGSYVLTFASAN